MQIVGYNISNILWYFMIYSVLGWCLEVIYCTVNSGTVENRGFLDGPVCPVYGFGMVLIIFIIRAAGFEDVRDCPNALLFFGGMILASSVELLAGWGLMKLFRMRWWDYSDKPFNIGGYICLKFSIYWGLGSLLVINLVHIPLTNIIEGSFFSGHYCYPMLIACVGVYVIDLLCTVRNIVGINNSIDRFEELNKKLGELSEELSQKLGTRALEVDQIIDEAKDERAQLIREWEEEKEEIFKEFEGNRFMGIRKIMHIQRIRRNERVQRIWDWHLKKHNK
ncbi:MAG: putative ABC transporter permease [Clostridia bacterium]|nr:putative ABC transporter permease [Clostridia bacterium]